MRCEDFCILNRALEQEEKVNNVACLGSWRLTCFGAYNGKNSLQNSLHHSFLSELRRENATNCKSFGPPGLWAAPISEQHRWHTVPILGNESLKHSEQMKIVLNYTAGNFGTLEKAINNPAHDMEQVQQEEVCDHKRNEVFTFLYKTQSLINNISFALISLHSEVQSFKNELKHFNNKIRDAFQEMSNGRIPSRLVEPDKPQRILQFYHKTRSRPLQHISLYYELELLRTVLLGTMGSSWKIEIQMSSQSPIHKVFKEVPLTQPIANSTTASVFVAERELRVVSEACLRELLVVLNSVSSCKGRPQNTE